MFHNNLIWLHVPLSGHIGRVWSPKALGDPATMGSWVWQHSQIGVLYLQFFQAGVAQCRLYSSGVLGIALTPMASPGIALVGTFWGGPTLRVPQGIALVGAHYSGSILAMILFLGLEALWGILPNRGEGRHSFTIHLPLHPGGDGTS